MPRWNSRKLSMHWWSHSAKTAIGSGWTAAHVAAAVGASSAAAALAAAGAEPAADSEGHTPEDVAKVLSEVCIASEA